MEEYITSIRSGAMTVNEFIKFLKDLDGAATVWLSSCFEGQFDIFSLDNGDIEIR